MPGVDHDQRQVFIARHARQIEIVGSARQGHALDIGAANFGHREELRSQHQSCNEDQRNCQKQQDLRARCHL